MARSYPTVSEEYKKALEKARRKLRGLIFQNNCAPIVIILAWHWAWNYDGGPLGALRDKEDLSHGANKEMDVAVRLLEQIKEQFAILSYADIYQLAGVVAVEVTGGPEILFHPGRKDNPQIPVEGRLLDATEGFDHRKNVFFKQMLISELDFVALIGAHALERCHEERTGLGYPCTSDGLIFDNSFFVDLLCYDEEDLRELSTEKALLSDPEYRPLVEKYAADEDAFFADYAEAHQKLSELVFADA